MMRTLWFTVVLASVVPVGTAFAQDTTRFSEHGVVFDHPKGWKVIREKSNEDQVFLTITNAKGTAAMLQLYPAGTDPKALRHLMEKGMHKQFEGKLVKGSDKTVMRKLLGSSQEGVSMEFDVSGVVVHMDIFAFALPSKKRVACFILSYATLFGEAARKDLDLVANSLAEGEGGAVPAAGPVIAETGFNDTKGMNSNAAPDSPYPLDAPNRQGGTGEPGWVGMWTPASPRAVFQKKIVFEGDGALYLTNTGLTRRFSEQQKGRFIVEQYVQVPQGGGTLGYIRNGEGPTGDGPVWSVLKGRFSAFHDGKWIDTPFTSEPGKWHKVVLTIDVPALQYSLSVDDRKFKPAQPLLFRSNVDRLDTIRYQCENMPGVYIDAVRVLRIPGTGKK